MKILKVVFITSVVVIGIIAETLFVRYTLNKPRRYIDIDSRF